MLTMQFILQMIHHVVAMASTWPMMATVIAFSLLSSVVVLLNL